MTTTTPIAPTLANLVAGHVYDHDGDLRIRLDSGFIYAALGKVRLQRPGKPVVTLGTCASGAEALAESYWGVVR